MTAIFPYTLLKELSARMKSLLKLSGGFTLVEVLIALAILGIIIPAAVGIFAAGNNYLSGGGSETIAVKIAQERLEEVKSLKFASVQSKGFTVEGGITECYGEIEDFPRYKRVTEVTGEENPFTGEEDHLQIARIKVTVYRDGETHPQHERNIQHETLHTYR